MSLFVGGRSTGDGEDPEEPTEEDTANATAQIKKKKTEVLCMSHPPPSPSHLQPKQPNFSNLDSLV